MLFRHDIGVAYADAITLAVLAAAVQEHDADKHAASLGGLPILARVGQQY